MRCIVAQVPLVSGHDNVRRLVRADCLAGLHRMFAEDRRGRMAGKPPATMPVVAEDQWAPSVLPTPGQLEVVQRDGARPGTVVAEPGHAAFGRDVHRVRTGSYVPFISPTPLLMVVALGDVLTAADLALTAYERVLAPKRLVTLAGGHFDAYVADFQTASQAAVEWFTQHLA